MHKNFRNYLRCSAALAVLAGPAVAVAEEAAVSINPGYAASVSPAGARQVPAGFLETPELAPHTGSKADFDPELAPHIVIANPGTPTTARDPVNITGVGQMVVDAGGGSIGLCTGSLINPRTVLFAAHCVNTRQAQAYGAGSGGVPISFGFQADNLPALQRWFNATIGGQANPLRYQSNPGLALYNVNQVRYNELSLEPEAIGFLYGDVATATLDTPAANIPTWALLFSPLAPSTVTAAGTGYNVGIAGYGRNGNATTGSANGSDFRRRIADNVLGALTDLRTFETFLFGASVSPTQNVYFIDFDDPRRGQSGASVFDFNAFRDNARGTNEGTTAGGDSGGPLILQNAQNLRIALGVLSGGYTRFFNGQPANGYGTVSFYQPLYLYWDWIAANNPYRYVSNIAGDRLWTDAANWVTTLDPNYQIIGPNGQIINGIPTSPGEQKNGRSGQFGEICFESGGASECLNVASGQVRADQRPIGTGDEGVSETGEPVSYDQAVSATQVAEADVEVGAQALPAATLANGLPGATGFTPNNVDPNRLSGAIGRYFDVTLGAAGTTTLNSAVTIDRFTIRGANSRLNITSGGSLTSLIDVTQMTGGLNIDGRLTSRGDFLMLSGLLSGSGRLAAPFVTNVMGTIAPGGVGAIGNLTVEGNLVLSAGSQFLVDIGPSSADRLSVVAGSGQTGTALLGGSLLLNSVGAPAFGQTFTVLSAAGGVTGTFTNATADVSPILFGRLVYTPQNVSVRVEARPFASVANAQSASQQFAAALLDQNRTANYASLATLFGPLDVTPSVAALQASLESLVPQTEATKRSQARVMTEVMSNFTSQRMMQTASGDLAGTLMVGGNPTALALGSMVDSRELIGHAQTADGAVRRDLLPSNVSAFVQAGYFDGRSEGLFASDGRHDIDGWYAAVGGETYRGASTFGASLSYMQSDGSPTPLQASEAEAFQGVLYTTRRVEDGAMIGVSANLGTVSFDSTRTVVVGGAQSTLRSSEDALTYGAEVNVWRVLPQTGFRVTPLAGLRYGVIEFDGVTETGGIAALTVDSDRYHSLQARLGLKVDAPYETARMSINPHLSANLAGELLNDADPYTVGFSTGTGGFRPITPPGGSDLWGEVTAGMAFSNDSTKLDLSVHSTVGRDDLDFKTYRAALSMKF